MFELLFRIREIGCPSFIKDCKHVQPGQPGYLTPAQREEEALEQARVQAAQRAKKAVEKPIREPEAGAEDEGEITVEAEDRVSVTEESRQIRRVFKEKQRADKTLRREARAVIRRRDRSSNENEINTGRVVNRGVAAPGSSGGIRGGSVVAANPQHGIHNFLKTGNESDSESDSDSDGDTTDTSLSDNCSEVDGSNSDYEDVYNYEEGSPEMIDADEEMGFCNADTEGIHVTYLPRAKKIRFTEEGNSGVKLSWINFYTVEIFV